MNLSYREIETAIGKTGLVSRGGFHPDAADTDAPTGARTIILVGDVGGALWPRFEREMKDEPDPLDTWTQRIMEPVAADLRAKLFYPFGGPPHWPFQTWAMRAEGLKPSPIGPLMHPAAGPWHSYRAALGFDFLIDLPSAALAHACDSCPEKPCLTACPVEAFAGPEFNLAACLGHLSSSPATACMTDGCLARRACPVGAEMAYSPPHQAFLARQFVRAFGGQIGE